MRCLMHESCLSMRRSRRCPSYGQPGATLLGSACLAFFRLTVLALSLFGSLQFFGQEVVVFKDHRSLVVSRHRQAGEWTYLTVEGGEMAVMTASIAEVRNEGAAAMLSAKAAAVPATTPQPQAPDEMPPALNMASAEREPSESLPPEQPKRPPVNPAIMPSRAAGTGRLGSSGLVPVGPGGKKR